MEANSKWTFLTKENFKTNIVDIFEKVSGDSREWVYNIELNCFHPKKKFKEFIT